MNPEFEVVLATRSLDRVVTNLLEFYFHDLAEWFKFDQQPDGHYTESTDPYWRDDCGIYLLYTEKIPVGFAIVGSGDEWLPGRAAKDMTEFFIVRRHRRAGIGREFAWHIWRLHAGPWIVRVFQPNSPALPFWRHTVSEFSRGKYEEQVIQKKGKDWSHFVFDSRES